MSQYTINIGALPNDGTGDPLRTAFNETNLNFNQIFAAGPVLSNVQIANNTILTTNTNGNLVLNPNGIGIVQANAHVVPDQTRIRNLGSANLRWDTTYTQYLQTTYATIGTANIGNIGNLTVSTGNIHILGGSNGYVLQTDGTGNLSWTAQTGGSGNGTPGGANTQVQFNDAGAFGGAAGFTFDPTSNTLSAVKINTTDVFNSNGIVLENSDLTQGATAAVVIPTNGSSDPIQVNNTYGNIALQTGAGSGITASWSFDNTGNLTIPGNINYANGVSILASSGNVSSLVNGSQTLSLNSDGTVTMPLGSVIKATTDSYTGISTSNGNTFAYVNSGGFYVNTLYNTADYEWQFDNTGTLNLPQGGVVYETNIPFGGLSGKTIALKPYGGTDADQQLLVYPTAGADFNHLHLTSGNLWNTELFLGNDNFYVKLANTGNIVINSNDDVGNSAQWSFSTTGNLNLPQGGYIGAAGVKGDGTMLTGGTGQIASLTSFYADAPGIYAGCFTANPDGNVNISTYGNGTGLIGSWAFDNTGNLTVPGNIIMTTGIVGSGASPAPYLSGFDSVSAVTLSASGNVTGAYVKGNGSELTNLPAPVVTQDITSNGAMSIMTYDGNIKYVNYATVEPSTGNIAGGNISAIGNVSAGNVSTTGNITAANFIGNTFSLAQTILPTIQSIVISNTSSEYETSGGSGYANVLVANVAPVIEYGVIVTAGSTVDKYVTGNLANIPGTEKITISTGTSDQPFTVYAYVTTNAGTYYSGPEVGFSGLCLLKGTMISLADGTYKPIEDINNDDLLLTWDFDLGRYAQARPLWIKRGETGTRYNELTFSDGTILRTFDQHRIFNKQAGAFTYPMSDDTPVGTVTVNEHGQEITLVKRKLVWDTIEHYNIITNYHINLFANSVLTSCRFNNIYPITDMKFVKSVVLNRNLSEFAEIESRFVFGLRLQEQSFELAMIEGYVNRLLATEVTESISI